MTTYATKALELIAQADEIACERSNLTANSAEAESIMWSRAHGYLDAAYTVINSLREQASDA